MQKEANFKKFLKQNLNAIQLEAVNQKSGAMLVIAGAGSGKTRIITARIANLILNSNESSDSIIALTFTNKAAKEMKDRINNWLPIESRLPFIGTFHSFCLRILKANRNLIEIPQFSILDDDDQLKIIQSIIQRNALNKKMNARQLQYGISQIKNNLSINQTKIFNENKIVQEVFLAYEHERKTSKCLDFDDLIIETVKLFKNNLDFKKNFQSQVNHVLVDEYQDTNKIQHIFLKEISQNNKKKLAIKSLCVVGDEDQSIYSWRGATVENIVFFKEDFENTSVIKIEQNYRSVQPILEVANKIINNNKIRNPKKLWSDKKARNRILHITCTSEYKESEMIVQAIKTIESIKSLNSIAILYRTHFQSRAIEEALIKNSIPYIIIGGIQFYERKEIKDVIAYLKLVINPFDKVSFFRIINCPTRKLGEKFEEEFYQHWSEEPFLNFIDISKKLIDQKKLTKTKEDSLANFIKIFENLHNLNPVQAINKIISEVEYINYLKNNFDRQDAEAKIDNIKELLRAAFHFQEQGIHNITTFLEEITLMQQKMSKENSTDNKIQLMTLHSAKGLEFDTVIISGIEEGIIPSKKSNQDHEIEEERRLFYVGITRAKEYLICSNVKYRNSFGQTNVQQSSRFLEELPKSLIYQEDSSNYYTNEQFSILFSQFFGIKTNPKKIYTYKGAKLDKKHSEGKWKKNQIVRHKQFGVGMIEKIENKDTDRTFLTIKFKSGTKKIDSSFLENI